jgi:hypothetical protein
MGVSLKLNRVLIDSGDMSANITGNSQTCDFYDKASFQIHSVSLLPASHKYSCHAATDSASSQTI